MSYFHKLTRLVFFTVALTLFGAQCIRFGGGGAQGAGGGVFKSVNRGEQWTQKVAVPTSGGVKNFGGANVTVLTIDPQDHQAIYVGTRESGMFYSYDGGESWSGAKAMATGFVAAIAVDPKNKCRIYVAHGAQIKRSNDCSRTFEMIYNEAAPQTFVSAVVSHPLNPSVLYAGTTRGAVLKSVDSGASWTIQANLQGKIVDLVVDPRSTAIVYAAVGGRGVWRSTDDGRTFQDISGGFKTISDANDVRRLILDRATPHALLLASKYKLMRSTDDGATWVTLPIISPESVEILALAVNPKNSKEVYYGTATTFYRSLDGGQSWSTEQLPTKRQASSVLVDPVEPATIYLGILEVKR